MPLTVLQKAIGEFESDLRYLKPDPLRWDHNRKELLDQLNYIKKLAHPMRMEMMLHRIRKMNEKDLG